MKKIKSIFFVMCIVLLISSCSSVEDNVKNGKKLTSSNGNVKITVPLNWGTKNLGVEKVKTMIEAGGEDGDKFLMIVRSDKADYDEGLTHEKFDDLALGQYKKESKEFDIREIKKEKILDEKGNTYILFSVVEEKKIITQFVTVDKESNFYQIIMWTNENKYDDYKEEFLEMAKSFTAKY